MPKEEPVVLLAAASTSASNTKKESACEECGAPVDAKVVFFCRVNKEKFGGKTICHSCQQTLVAVPAAGPKSAEPNEGASAAENVVDKKGTCGKCGAAVDGKVVFFCRINKEKFDGKILCRSCQKTS